MNIAIVDDEPVFLKQLHNRLREMKLRFCYYFFPDEYGRYKPLCIKRNTAVSNHGTARSLLESG